jgi:hypothetical protein
MEFRQKTPQQEYKLIQNDSFDFFETKKYLEPLIEKALNHFKLTKIIHKKLMMEILSDVPTAIKKFITNKDNIKNA